MRLIKIFIPFSILCFSFIFCINSVKASDNYILDFNKYSLSFGEIVHKDFDSYMKDNGLDYFLIDISNYMNVPTIELIFFKASDFSNISLVDTVSSNYRYLNLHNISDISLYGYYCNLSYSNYNIEESGFSQTKKGCLEKIQSFLTAPNTNGFKISPNANASSSRSVLSKQSTDQKRRPYYVSNENITFDLQSDFTISYNDSTFDVSTITAKDLFYANHEGIFEEKNSSNFTVDLTNVEKLLYFICFILFAFFIVLVFKIAIRFIHMILPI